MRSSLTSMLIAGVLLSAVQVSKAQLVITDAPNALALAQRLVGDGVTISNVSFTGNLQMTGFFNNTGGGTNIPIDSGIILTSGRARSTPAAIGVNGNGISAAFLEDADNAWGLPGDANLATAIGLPASDLEDACVLEFDFTPLGDSIKFNYVFSSEEYTPAYVCDFNDAFAFFISGPGITGLKNIALVPNTTIPVSIFNVNDVPGGGCPNNIAYYINNRLNTFCNHDGHTTLLTAKERVQPCQTYHLKLVISDVGDDLFDSGVFLQARSLSSPIAGITNLTQTDPATGLSYLVEGCATGAFNIRRARKDPVPLSIQLSYGGTAINGVDVALLPSSAVIPANDSIVTIFVNPTMDLVPEGIETLKIYALAGCAFGPPTDSTLIQLRDYDILDLVPDTATICRNASIQLTATTGYTTYQWNPDPTLSSTTIRDPVATPVNSATTYICTANVGTCNAQDSVLILWNDIEFISKQDIFCRNGTNGNIKVAAGPEWAHPIEFSLDGINWQSDSSFYNLPVGNYYVKVRNASCIDSILVSLVQSSPDLVIDSAIPADASCSGAADGQINISASGGTGPYTYSIDGTNFQPASLFNVVHGPYTVTVKDVNGCLQTSPVVVALNNTVTVDAGIDNPSICEGKSYIMPAVSNGTSFAWTPAATLSNAAILTPTATPTVTTKYYITATTGICNRIDSVTVDVRPAPIANAGPDAAYCYGKVFQLDGSGGATYEWSPSTYIVSSVTDEDPSVKSTAPITYRLYVTDATGCRSLTDDEVRIDVVPAVKLFAGRDTVAAIGQPIQLNAVELNASGVTQYTWTPADYLSNPLIANPIATLPRDMRYIVTGTTPEGCEGKDDIFIKAYKGPEIYVPSGFTPDNNGLNDVLRPIPVGIKEFRFFRVFNRWGQLVFSTSDPRRGWDGTINGVPQPTGSFVWMAEAVDFRGNVITRKGVFTIIR
ncbi:MAG: choice-of-anchor L domain-containing protein [Chitinophagaceae bacterium]|nr:choice-of-anchor L domain-containing protein [Chitinophagaceae bacterium]